MKILSKIHYSKIAKNASWLIIGKIIQRLITLVTTFLTARYLGPNNYGIIGYISSYTAFFSSLCDLGINGIIVKEYVKRPEKQGKNTFTALILKLASSTITCTIFVIFMFSMHPNEPEYYIIAILLSLSSIFNSFNVISYWYQSRLESKKEAFISTFAYIIVALYTIIILMLHLSVEWFALANSLNTIIAGILLVIFYFKDKGQKWKFSFREAKNLLKQSYHLILSGILVSIFAQTDKIMIGNFMTQSDVGYYAVAVTLSGAISFLPSAIIDSLRPVIMDKKNKNEQEFVARTKQLYAIIIWISIAYSVFITIFADFIVSIIYGQDYLPAIPALKIAVWYCSFSYLGSAKNVWLIAQNKQKYEKWFTLIGAGLNIVLNFLLIPKIGISGAAIATLITQAVANFLAPFIFKDTRDSSKYMLEALNIHKLLRKK